MNPRPLSTFAQRQTPVQSAPRQNPGLLGTGTAQPAGMGDRAMRDATPNIFANRQMPNRIPMQSMNPNPTQPQPQAQAINPAAAPGSPDIGALQAQIKALQEQIALLTHSSSRGSSRGRRLTTDDVHAANRAATGNKLGMGIGGSLLPIPTAPFRSMQPKSSKADRTAMREKERAQFKSKSA